MEKEGLNRENRATLELCEILTKAYKDFATDQIEKEKMHPLIARMILMSALNGVVANTMVEAFPDIPNESLLESFINGARAHPRWNDKKEMNVDD